MPQRKKIRSDQEWLELIQECRASGLPDREWCQIHSISINTFYNKVSDLRKKACVIPKTQAAASRQKHEVVPLELAGSPARSILPVTRYRFQPPVPLLRSGCRGTALKLLTALQRIPYAVRSWRWGGCIVRRIVRRHESLHCHRAHRYAPQL